MLQRINCYTHCVGAIFRIDNGCDNQSITSHTEGCLIKDRMHTEKVYVITNKISVHIVGCLIQDRQSRSLLPRPHLVLEYLILTDLMFNTNNKMPRTLRHIIEHFLNRDNFNTSICHLLKELANRFQILSVLSYYYICPILSCSIWFTNTRCSSSQIPFCAKINACPFIHKFKISFLSLAKSTVSK